MSGLGTQLRAIRKERGLVQADLARRLGISPTTIANYEQGIRFPDEATLNKLADFFNVSVDRLLGRTGIAPAVPDEGTLNLEAATLYELLAANKLAEGMRFVEGLRGRGWDLLSIHLGVFRVLQEEVGRRWERGEVDVYQEHAITALIRHLMGALSADIPHNPDGPRFLGLIAPGEFHEIGLLAVTDVLRIDGWNTLYLGLDVPPASLVASIRDFHPHVVGISVTMERNLGAVEALARWVRSLPDSPRIMVGGRAFGSERAERAGLAADAVVHDLNDLIVLARRLLEH